jgi:hypothetical protein
MDTGPPADDRLVRVPFWSQNRNKKRMTLSRRITGPMSLGIALAILSVLGCAAPAPIDPGAVVLRQNPVMIPATHPDFLWDQLVDVVDDYFTIQREQRVQNIGGIISEGRLDTLPVTGATLLEPWRWDSPSGYDRLESTLQTIRRFAVVRAIPDEHGFLVDVAVYKELEDLQQGQQASAGASTFRTDTSLERFVDPIGAAPITAGWIPLGRDTLLEQEILAQIQARMGIVPGGYAMDPAQQAVGY